MRLLLFASFLVLTTAAYADGGRLLVREPAGPFVVSLFSAPDVLAVGPVDLSAMVEEKSSGRPLLDAEIAVSLSPVGRDATPPIVLQMTHAGSADRLLEGAVVRLPHAGLWRAVIAVHEGGREGILTTELTAANHSSRRGTIWFFAISPLVAIALFAWVQIERQRTRDATLRHTT